MEEQIDEKENYIRDEITGKAKRDPMAILNKKSLSKTELDELMIGENYEIEKDENLA